MREFEVGVSQLPGPRSGPALAWVWSPTRQSSFAPTSARASVGRRSFSEGGKAMEDEPAEALWRRWGKAAMATARRSTEASVEAEATSAEWARTVGLHEGACQKETLVRA